jgi:hypothetical protein
MTLCVLLLLSFDLTSVKSEPNLEKRSELAIANANLALDNAKQAYEAGDPSKTGDALKEVADSVDLAYDSLSQTGKDPRGAPRYFKRAEMSLRLLLRRLEGVAQNFSVTDRPKIEEVRAHVSEVHDNLIEGIMSKKKKGAK